MADTTKALSEEDIYSHLYEKIFPLRPADYCSKYPNWPGLVGIELEMLPVRVRSLDADRAETVPLYGPGSISEMLFEIQKDFPAWTYNAVPEGSHHLMNVLLEDSDQLSFEPGGQFEFSSKPYPCLTNALERVSAIQDLLFKEARKRGIEILQIGMNPWLSVDEIGLQMDKPRYQAMNAFFAAQGVHGQRMMRQTCTVQLNLDFGGTEAMLAKRYLASNLIAPHATAIFANSPLHENRPTGLLSTRASTWQHMDESRTGFPNLDEVERTLSRKACVDAYRDWIMNGRVIFVEGLDYRVMDGNFRLRDWVRKGCDGVYPAMKDLQTHLSLQFPEVRARGFLELRSVDCQHRFWQAAPAEFFAGLLYDDQSLDAVLNLLLPHRKQLTSFWQRSSGGMRDAELAVLTQKVMNLAIEGFTRMPSCYQGRKGNRPLEQFNERYTARRLTPADELLGIFQKNGRLRARDLIDLEDHWTRVEVK